MKFRKGFVTNSSSSSYICDICGAEQSGWDLCLSDAEMFQCVNGHIFCEDHTENPFEKEGALRSYLVGKIEKAKARVVSAWATEVKIAEWIAEAEKDLIDFDNGELTKEDFQDELYDLRGELPEINCPICKFDEFINSDLLTFTIKEYSLNKDLIKKAIKSKFKSYAEFLQYIKDKEK